MAELYSLACRVVYAVNDDQELLGCEFDGLVLDSADFAGKERMKCYQAFHKADAPCVNCPLAQHPSSGESFPVESGARMPEQARNGVVTRVDTGGKSGWKLIFDSPGNARVYCYRLYISSPEGERRAELHPREESYSIGAQNGDAISLGFAARKDVPRLSVSVGACWSRIVNTGMVSLKVIAPAVATLPAGGSLVLCKESFLECGALRLRLHHVDNSLAGKTAVISRPESIEKTPVEKEPVPSVNRQLAEDRRRFILERIWPEFNAKMRAGELERQGLSTTEIRLKAQERIREILDMLPYPFGDALGKDRLTDDCVAEFIGLGPLEALLRDSSITEIMVNGPNKIFVEKRGKLTLSDVTFLSSEFLRRAIERIVTSKNRRIDERVPYADTRLDDGSRVHAIIPPLAIDYPILTIRKFPERHYGIDDLIAFGSIDKNMAELLHLAVEHKQNLVVSGGTGTGKTTFLNICSRFIPEDERIITIEDSAELRLQKPHWLRLEARPPNIEGEGAVPIRELVRNSLRMRPDRIVVGECRGAEAFDMLQAMNTGHEGSMTTLHANSCRDALGRLESMCLMAGMDLPITVVRAQIASAINIIVQLTRMVDGSRRCTMIAELTGMDNGVISMSPLVEYKQTGMDANRMVTGHFKFTGVLPRFVQYLRESGHRVAESIYPMHR